MKRASGSLYYPQGQSADSFWSKVAESPSYARIVGDIRAEGTRIMREKAPALTDELFSLFERTGSRLEYERVYFERRRRLNTHMLLSLLEPEEGAHLRELQEMIARVLDEPTWCLPAHVLGRDPDKTIDLFSAETGFTLAEMACVLEERLPRSLLADIDEALSARLFRPLLEEGPHPWESARHNWSAVCAGSIGAAALLRLAKEDELAEVLTRTLASLDCYLEGFGDDGACLEGLGYWNYGFGYYVYFADLLRRMTEGGLNLFHSGKVRSIASFQQIAYLHEDSVVCFSDSLPHVPFRVGLTHYLARIYPEIEIPAFRHAASYTEDHCSRWAPAFRDLIWLDPDGRGEDPGPVDRYLPDAQWLISRCSDRGGESRFGFAAKGGHNDEPHNHNDIGHFILIADGMTVAGDLGAGEYTAAYFGDGRYEYDCNGSQGHSVPIVDGCYQSPGTDSTAIVLKAEVGEREDRLKLEMAGAYRVAGMKSLVRELIWRKGGDRPTLTLIDEFTFAERGCQVVERVAALLPPVIREDGTVAICGESENGLEALIRFDEGQLEAAVEKRSYRDHFGQERDWYAIDWKLRKTERVCRIELRFEWAHLASKGKNAKIIGKGVEGNDDSTGMAGGSLEQSQG
jgi:hypothetical protein